MITLIGNKHSKRTDFFKEAAKDENVSLSVIEWDEVKERFSDISLQGAAIKIDPPSYHTHTLAEMNGLLSAYQDALLKIEATGSVFLNSPSAILSLLNKRACKLQLQKANIPTTKMLSESASNTEQLLSLMEEKRVSSVFIKPVFFSGAAGVTAFRFQPKTKQMQLYTSCRLVNGVLVNTKTLYCLRDHEEIRSLLNALLQMDVMIERWYPKSVFHGKSYDLRVVYQFGHIAHIVVRQSNGPVTNLHLNNQALEIKELGLDSHLLEQMERICGEALSLFPGLSMAGIDVLIEKSSGKPYIIEMNGQGDLIYQDIYHENRIYREQVVQLAKLQN